MGMIIPQFGLIPTIGFGSSLGSNWTPQKIADTFLFYGETSKISGGRLNNQVLGSSDYLTVGGSAGSETYQAPDNATYKTADTDFIWFKQDASQRTVTTAELIGSDLQRTPIKYDDNSPNTVRIIAILKTGVTLIGTDLDQLFKQFQLPVFWDGILNVYGHVKNNRIAQNLWVKEEILGTELMPSLATWSAVGLAWWDWNEGGWSGDGTKLMSDGIGTKYLQKSNFWEIGVTYKIVISVTLTSGGLKQPFDAATTNGGVVSVTGIYITYYTPGIVNMNLRSESFVGAITNFSLKKLLMP